jgi:hypothetical protein
MKGKRCTQQVWRRVYLTGKENIKRQSSSGPPKLLYARQIHHYVELHKSADGDELIKGPTLDGNWKMAQLVRWAGSTTCVHGTKTTTRTTSSSNSFLIAHSSLRSAPTAATSSDFHGRPSLAISISIHCSLSSI